MLDHQVSNFLPQVRRRSRLLLAACGLIGALGWTAVAEAQNFNFLRIQDRTPGRMGDTNYAYSPACCTVNGTHTATVPYTVTAVQVRATHSSGHQIHQRLSSTTGPWGLNPWYVMK